MNCLKILSIMVYLLAGCALRSPNSCAQLKDLWEMQDDPSLVVEEPIDGEQMCQYGQRVITCFIGGESCSAGNQAVYAEDEEALRLTDAKQFRGALLRINDDATISMVAAVVDECYRAGLEKMQFFPEGGDGGSAAISPKRDATHVPLVLRHCPDVDLSACGRQLVLVDIVRDGRLFLKGVEITHSNLESYLQTLIVKAGPAHEMYVVFRPDQEVRFGTIKDMIRLCVKAGIWRVFMAGDSRGCPCRTPVFPVNWP